ncbi:hypothetical protein [Gaetbulibacter aestuarii]|uniref:Uncharacterized protein n=1 Tax=Gaetbulibacter aestuarii TaxID=1502358 RepID=A0ABW7MXC5_9FLAO
MSTLESIGLLNKVVKNENSSAFLLEMKQPDLSAKITIPIDVYEIFIDIKFEGNILTGWDDFYGKSKKEDYLEKLSEIKEILEGKAEIIIENNMIYFSRDTEYKRWF